MRSEHVVGLVLALSTVALGACSGGPGETEPTASDSQAVVHRSPALKGPTFVTISPGAKSGYEVAPVNSSASPTHVTQLDFSKSGLDTATATALTTAPASEVLLEGSVSSGTLYVTAAYRGMPGVTYASDATFYQAGGAVAQAVNESVTRKFVSVDVSAAAKPFVQQSWLVDQVENKNAIVAGHVTQAAKALTAQQVFVALPYVGGPCVVSETICPLGDTQTFTRDEHMCAVFAGCAPRTVCPLFVPYCGEGYALESWTSAPNACASYACDPSFIH
jgi:hypothetical protein